MKKQSYILLGLAAAALFLRRRAQSGVGKVRRNIFTEIELLQKLGVPLGQKWSDLSPEDMADVRNAMRQSGYKQPAASVRTGRSPEESYYNALSRQYLKLVNPAIGRIQYPHTTSTIRNSRGDVVLTYNDYDPERDMVEALSWFSDSRNTYNQAVYHIAKGAKFRWDSRKKGGVRLSTGLKEAIFGQESKGDRKYFRQILNKDGYTIEQAAEAWGTDNGSMDDYNAVVEAVRDFASPKAAKEYILSQYYQSLDDGQPDYAAEDPDLPF